MQNLEQLAEELTTDLISELPYATGYSRMTTRFVAEDDMLKLVCPSYLYYVENGRKAGKRPPIDVIAEWIMVKGIDTTDISVKSLAHLIARKIGERGIEPKRVVRDLVLANVSRIKDAMLADQIIHRQTQLKHLISVFNNKING